MRTFENVLVNGGSCAQDTLIAAMCEWWMAKDEADAKHQIAQAPGADLAGIKNSVVAGLTKAAEMLDVDPEQLIAEENLAVLKNLTAAEIVEVLDAIHLQWIEDNFTAKRWAEKYFKGQLPQYRKTSRIDWTEVVKDLLFMQKYLIAGGSEVSVEEIEAAFGEYVADDTAEDDIPAIKARAMTLAEEIIPQMEAFKLKAKPEIAAKVKAFLEEHQNPDEIMRIMVSSI